MKICVTSTGPALDALVDPRFGRCQYFMIVDSDTMEFEAISNPSIGASSGAGIQAAQTVANKGISVVITGNVGPNAIHTLSATDISVLTGASGTVSNAIEQYKNGVLQQTVSPTAPAHTGMPNNTGTDAVMYGGRGVGRGGGRGGGRGMGQGMGSGMGQVPPATSVPSSPALTKDEEIQALENQMEEIKSKLEELKKQKIK